MFLLTAKKEDVEAIERDAKDKHEKEWEGKKWLNAYMAFMISRSGLIWRRLKIQKGHAVSVGL